ncbi:amino acid permease [Myxococcota bacterium]|nr:amino acid permease [Myxococcota bacterium]MBU1534048.1 amino acid permease [Myxococcota bacterium]
MSTDSPQSETTIPSGPVITQGRFGTFGGVFTPCVLTILGVIMFMRTGTVVGESGIWRALLILLMAKSITTLTTMSLSAIATNTDVRTGGVYFMISRTLGPDFGGAIGIMLFISQAISIAFYVIGFSEALFAILAAQGPDATLFYTTYKIPQIVSTLTIVTLFGVTFKGADVALKAQYLILAVLLLSVVSFTVGGILHFSTTTFNANMGTRPGSQLDFWIVFAIFFPAATGITAGANMSGDLKNPGISIPRGTILAIAFTAAIYVLLLVLMAGYTNQNALAADPFGSLKNMSIFGPLIIAGVFAATLSSALGSFLGAPRILQAMGQDKLLPPLEYFGVGHGPENEPHRATVLSFIIAVAIIWAGGLNAVAQVISMFFLIAYGMINFSAFVEGRAGNPSFRPRFKVFGWPAALIGALGSAYAMVKINETYAFISMVIAAAVYFGLKGRAQGKWDDAKRGYIFSRTRENLLLLESTQADAKNWRPALMVITEDFELERPLILSASWVESGRGILSILELRHNDGSAEERFRERDVRLEKLRRLLKKDNIIAFSDSVILDDPPKHLDTILQSYSIGSLRPNTIMIAFPPPDQVEKRQTLVEIMPVVAAFRLNVIIYREPVARFESKRRTIDLWWAGQNNGSLMAIFSYLVTTHDDWSNAEIRLMRIVKTIEEKAEAELELSRLVLAARIQMHINIIISEKPVTDIITESSANSDLVILGLSKRDLTNIGEFFERNDELLSTLPRTMIIHSAGDADLLA